MSSRSVSGRRRPFPGWIAVCVLAGLATAEIAAAFHVHWSNRDLYRSMTAILDAGYLAVPNTQVIPTLLSPGTAFYGGVFYTLSVGAALITLSLVFAWAWDRFFHRDRRALLSPILLWAACLIGVNYQGIALLATAHFLIVPPVVFFLAVFLMPSRPEARHGNREWLIHPIALVLLAALGAGQMEAEVFSRFRNRCLLNNPVGLAVNDFYYRYTLYAAQTFKSLDQRLLKTCHPATDSPALSRRMASRLVRYDYLPIGDRETVDLRVEVGDNHMLLKSGDRLVLQASQSRFFGETRQVLDDFSAKTDRHGFLRGFTFVCLIGQSLVVLYLFFSLPFQLLLRPFLAPFVAKSAAAVICLLICWTFFQFLQPRPLPDIGAALASDDRQQQAAALEAVVDRKLEIADFPVYARLLDSPDIAVRYRLARALGVSRSSATYAHLVSLLEDDSFTVVYQVYWGLGRRGRPEAIPRIQAGIAASDHWYVQLYAYNALRRLGWKQTASD